RGGDHLSCIKRWQAVFCDEQFLTIMFDDIIKDPGGILVRLCRRLGVNAGWVGEVSAAELAMPVFAGPGYDLSESLLAFLPVLHLISGAWSCRLTARSSVRWSGFGITCAVIGWPTRCLSAWPTSWMPVRWPGTASPPTTA